jgi:hypothetical protein
VTIVGSAGHAFISHTKALSPSSQVKDAGYGLAPHPLAARPGQRFWPRGGRRRRPFVIRRVHRQHGLGVRLDGNREPVRVSLARLLEVREDGQGRHYQFHGFTSRRYDTWAQVCRIEDGQAVLCVPEWHPRRPVRLPVSLVPEPGRSAGVWLRLRCDLSAPTAARLEPSDLTPGYDPGPGTVRRPSID